MSVSHSGLSGGDLSLLHAKLKLSMGSRLQLAEKLGAITGTLSRQRKVYGPVPSDAAPVDTPLPESVKGAIANAHS